MKKIFVNKSKLLIILCFSLFHFFGMAQTFQIPEKPSLIPPIIDSTKTLSETQLKQLYDKLKNYSDSTSTEIFVMIVPTTQGENIARYATDLGQKWQIGQKGKDNGIVFLIAKNDKKMTIQTGYGTEHLMTDALSRRIIETVVKPYFKENNYFEGVNQGTTAIMQVMKGEYKASPKKQKDFPILPLIIIVFIILVLVSKNKNSGGGNSGNSGGGGPSLLDVIILSSLAGGRGSSGGFGGGSSGGGGFGGGFGGGGFSGGGSGGDW